MGQITDVVKNLIILNVVVFILTYEGLPLSDLLPDLSLFYPGDTRFKPYQVISHMFMHCLLYTSPSPRDRQKSRMPSSA